MAQALYEQQKLLSYPRTDSRHLSTDVAATLRRGRAGDPRPLRRACSPPGTGERPLGPPLRRRRARSPTTTPSSPRPPRPTAARSPRRAQDLRPGLPPAPLGLARRSRLVGDHGDHRDRRPRRRARSRCSTASTAPAPRSSRWAGRCSTSAAERRRTPKDGDEEDGRASPTRRTSAGSAAGPRRRASRSRCWTRAPSPSRPGRRRASPTRRCSPPWRPPAGRWTSSELSEAMRDSGLGTPATRAAIIETLLRAGTSSARARRWRRRTRASALIEVVHPHVKSPAMTGEWEAQLQRIQRGRGRARGVHGGASRST